MTTIKSILDRLTTAVTGTDIELFTEEKRTKFATFYLDKWDENTSEDVIESLSLITGGMIHTRTAVDALSVADCSGRATVRMLEPTIIVLMTAFTPSSQKRNGKLSVRRMTRVTTQNGKGYRAGWETILLLCRRLLLSGSKAVFQIVPITWAK